MALISKLFSDEGKLNTRAKRGSIWVTVTNLITNFVNMATTIVLARWFLGPKDFGVIGIIVILSEIMRLLSFQGVCDALIYMKSVDRKSLDTFTVTTGFLGSIFFVLTYWGAPFVAEFFKNNVLIGTLKIIAFTFPLMSISSVPLAVLRKNLDFRKESYVLLLAQAIGTVTTIILAFNGYNVFSVVYGLLAKAIAQTILSFLVNRYLPKPSFDIKVFREIFDYIKFVTSGAGLMFLLNRSDQFLIGKFLGDQALGYYSTAFNIINYMLTTPRMTLNKVLFSTFSKMQDNVKNVRNNFIFTGKQICTLFIPLFAGLGATSDVLVTFLLGEKWLMTAGALKILSFFAIVKIIGIAFPQVIKSVGRTEYIFRYNAGRLLIMIPALIIASHYSIFHVGVTMVSLLWIFKPLEIYMLKNAIGITPKQYLKIFIFPLLASMMMWGIIFVTNNLIQGLNDLILLLVLIGTGAISYVLLMVIIDISGVFQFRQFVKNYLN